MNSIKFKEEMSRHNYVTPTSYLELLGIFSKLVGMKKMELNTSRNRLKTGLEKVDLFLPFPNIIKKTCPCNVPRFYFF